MAFWCCTILAKSAKGLVCLGFCCRYAPLCERMLTLSCFWRCLQVCGSCPKRGPKHLVVLHIVQHSTIILLCFYCYLYILYLVYRTKRDVVPKSQNPLPSRLAWNINYWPQRLRLSAGSNGTRRGSSGGLLWTRWWNVRCSGQLRRPLGTAVCCSSPWCGLVCFILFPHLDDLANISFYLVIIYGRGVFRCFRCRTAG